MNRISVDPEEIINLKNNLRKLDIPLREIAVRTNLSHTLVCLMLNGKRNVNEKNHCIIETAYKLISDKENTPIEMRFKLKENIKFKLTDMLMMATEQIGKELSDIKNEVSELRKMIANDNK